MPGWRPVSECCVLAELDDFIVLIRMYSNMLRQISQTLGSCFLKACSCFLGGSR